MFNTFPLTLELSSFCHTEDKSAKQRKSFVIVISKFRSMHRAQKCALEWNTDA